MGGGEGWDGKEEDPRVGCGMGKDKGEGVRGRGDDCVYGGVSARHVPVRSVASCS